ncbi:MAG: RNA polymerase sigma factor [Eubacteriales bacterium]|nr:RNA polymerase sigma factor [Eubacteriales bacterium]
MRLDPTVIDGYLSGVKTGSKESFESVYRYSKELLYVYALSVTGDRLGAEDAVQEAYVKVWQNADKYKPGGNGLAWLITIARHAALDEKDKRRCIVVSDETAKKGLRKSHEEAVVCADYVDFIMKNLKENERQVAMLHIYGDYTIKDIAVMLNIPVTAAQWRYTSALKKLKAALVREGTVNG